MKYPMLYIIPLWIILNGCHNGILYSSYQEIDHAHWKLHSPKEFVIDVNDTVSRYNLYIMLRNNEDYPYSNLILITRFTFPDNTLITDTLEYEMTDPSGHFLGSGFDGEKENKLLYKENVRFRRSGKYRFQVEQSMRERNSIEGIDPLPGVSDVGLLIEKTTRRL